MSINITTTEDAASDGTVIFTTAPSVATTDDFWPTFFNYSIGHPNEDPFNPTTPPPSGDDFYIPTNPWDDDPGGSQFETSAGTTNPIPLVFVLVVTASVIGTCFLLAKRRLDSFDIDNGRSPTGRAPTTVIAAGGTRPVPRASAPRSEEFSIRRSEVLKALFPPSKVDDEALEYDEEAETLRWSNNNNKEGTPSSEPSNLNTRCSICLERFEEGDMIVSSLCRHIFHRDCIFDWMTGQNRSNEECPMCRQRMWDEETYNLMKGALREARNKEMEA